MDGDSNRELVRLLAERDSTCPACRYSLNGLGKPRCPECGLEITAEVFQDGFEEKVRRDRSALAWVAVGLWTWGLIVSMVSQVSISFAQQYNRTGSVDQSERLISAAAVLTIALCGFVPLWRRRSCRALLLRRARPASGRWQPSGFLELVALLLWVPISLLVIMALAAIVT